MILARELDPRGFVDFIKHPAVWPMMGGFSGAPLGLTWVEFRQWRLRRYGAEIEQRMRNAQPPLPSR